MAMNRYIPKEIEPKWQQVWRDKDMYKAIDFDERPKYVMLTEFPYPSGSGLHIGHIREFAYGDIISRYKRMHGFNVLFPMGYDAFGLPTENYAIKNKISPQKATEDNVANFQKQFESLGFSFDWSRSFRTSDPSYYKWTQWLFLQFFNKDLAYQEEIAINWCPHCKTGLSNEEVVNGRHERCDTLVEKKLLKQWLLKITDYADRLIDGLKDVDYPSRIADQQINWIGRSKGAEIIWQVTDKQGKETGLSITTFTTRKDTLPGVTFIVIAPEAEQIDDLTTDQQKDKVHAYIHSTGSLTDIERQENKEKTGVATGMYAKNPLTDEIVPIYAANYVLAGYGTGVVMGMPGHDERDREFAIKFNLPVVFTTEVPDKFKDTTETKIYTGEGTQINSGEPYDGLSNKDAGDQIFNKLVRENKASEKTTYRLRDWIFSRQHYWGEPIPIIHCEKDGAVAVPDDQLPVELPKVEHYEPTDNGESPLSEITEWVNVTCPKCGGKAKRETDTMPNWAGSSWYYLRYYDAHNDAVFADKYKLEYWKEVDLYLGGMEHTTLHLLYSRFWHQFFYDQKLVPTPEPYHARRGQGIVLAADGTKMSKTKGNVVNPSDIIDSGYGADALRLAIIFLAPYDQTTPWSPEGVAGTHRFLQRLWTLAMEVKDASPSGDASLELSRSLNKLIKKVSDDLDNMNYNTAVASFMECVNELYKIKAKDGYVASNWQETTCLIVQLIAPLAPHIAEELWQQLGQEGSVHEQAWPKYDEKYLSSDIVNIIVQINGKLRGQIEIAKDSSEEAVVTASKSDPKVSSYLDTQTIQRTIFVKDKLVNFVLSK
jgi:leucyl-tRNA synthetase